MLDVMNTMGISNSLIRVIERRQTTDLLFLFAGMAFTLVALYLTWVYVRRK